MLNYNLADAMQQSLNFLLATRTKIEAGVYEILYPDIQYPGLVPINTMGDPWGKSITYFSMDRFGKAQWFHSGARDVPVADFSLNKHEKTVFMAAIGYNYDVEELQQMQAQPNIQVTNERASSAVRIYEEFIDELVLRGDAEKGLEGLINRTDVSATDALADGDQNGGTNSPYWDHKTAAQIVRDFNSVITGMWMDSLNIELADTVALPYNAITLLTQMPFSANLEITVYDWLMKHNVYTAQTGRPLVVRGVRGLDGAAASSSGRMIAYKRDPQVLQFYLPMTHRFLSPMQVGPLTYQVPGIFRVGGLEVRRPGAIRYLDKVMAPLS